MFSEKLLEQYCIEAGFFLSSGQLMHLKAYLEILIQWNRSMNLVGPKDWETVFNKLIPDSFYLALFLQSLNLPVESIYWDIGAGAGLPGIPLRILWSDGRYWLIEAREKRALFLTTVLARYPLPNTYVYHGRVESIIENKHIPYPTVIISRAFMPWQLLLSFVEKFLVAQSMVILLQKQKIESMHTGWYIKADYSYMVENQRRFFIAFVKD